MTENRLLTSVPPDEVSYYSDYRDGVLESPSLLRRESLQQAGWIAVPRKQQGFVSMMEMERLAKALADIQVDELRLIYPTDPSVGCSCMAFPSTLDGLMEAATTGAFEAATMGALDYFITNSGKPVFLYHYTADDFSLLAGQVDFVEAALGASVKAARYDWHEYGSHPGWSDDEKAVYGEIERWYSAGGDKGDAA